MYMKSNDTKGDKPVKGRPRDFDPEIALEKAMNAFWNFGYETTSLSVLTKAMKLSAPSIYSAFGNKEQLFDKAVDLYISKFGVDIGMILNQAPTAREGVENCLKLLAQQYTEGESKGCMIISCATNCSQNSKKIQDVLRQRRKSSEHLIQRRIESGLENGELPAGTGSAELAKYYASVIQGMSLQAQDGSTRPELLSVAENAMRAWPSH